MGSEQEAREAVELYGDTVRRICMLHLKSYHDTEDIFQTVFLKYMLHTGGFQDREHEKAWIIRVTLNACRDFLRSFFRSRRVSLDEIAELVMKDNPYWEGSPTALVALMNVDIQPHVITRKLNVLAGRLYAEHGILFRSERVHEGRKLRFWKDNTQNA